MRPLSPWLSGGVAAVLLIPLAAELVSACGSKASTVGGGENASSSGGNSSGAGGGSSSGNAGGSSGASGGGGQGDDAQGGTSSGSGGNASSSGGGTGTDAGTPPPSTAFCLQAGSGDYSKTGPYAVSMKSVDLATTGEVDAGPTTATIFYPTNLEANCPHPIAAWGNGTGVTGSTVYGFFNNNVASWGIVVIAADNSNVASQPYLQAGIDYLLA